jgi:hypothetical protein
MGRTRATRRTFDHVWQVSILLVRFLGCGERLCEQKGKRRELEGELQRLGPGVKAIVRRPSTLR